MNKRNLLFLVTIFLFFSSCKGFISIYTYTSDLIDVASKKEKSLPLNVNIIIEGLKEEEDISFLKNNLNIFSNEKIVQIDYSDSLSFDTKIEILHNRETVSINEKDILCIKALEVEDSYEYKIVYNYELLKKIRKYVYETHYQNIDFKDFKINLIIDNDIKDTKSIVAYSVYVNDKPYPLIFEKILERREKLNLEFSEIMRHEISRNETLYPEFVIKKKAY
jgi:hypothetical protein